MEEAWVGHGGAAHGRGMGGAWGGLPMEEGPIDRAERRVRVPVAEPDSRRELEPPERIECRLTGEPMEAELGRGLTLTSRWCDWGGPAIGDRVRVWVRGCFNRRLRFGLGFGLRVGILSTVWVPVRDRSIFEKRVLWEWNLLGLGLTNCGVSVV